MAIVGPKEGSNVQKLKPTRHLVLMTALVTGLLVIPSSYEGALLNLPIDVYRDFNNQSRFSQFGQYFSDPESDSILSLMVAITGPGSIVGALLIPSIAKKFGNKTGAFFFGGLVIFVGSILGSIAKICNAFELLIVSQFLTFGMGWSFGYGMGTAYLAECSPPHLRGMIGTYANFGLTFAAIPAYAITFPNVLGSDELWPWSWAIGAIPAFLAMVLCPFLWESPKHSYMWAGDREKTRHLLTKFYGSQYSEIANTLARTPKSDDPTRLHTTIEPGSSVPPITASPAWDEWDSVLHDFEQEKQQASKQLPLKKLFTCYHLRQAVFLATMMALFNNVCGPPITNVFSTAIYNSLGFTRWTANMMTLMAQAVPVPIINVISSFFIDRYGRRPVMIYGGIAMIVPLIFYVILSCIMKYGAIQNKDPLSYLAVICILVNTWLGAGPSSISYFIYSEIVPQYALGMMTMYFVAISNVFYTVETQLFLPLQGVIDFWAILVLVVIPTVICIFYFWRCQQETRNKPINEIVNYWAKDAGSLEYINLDDQHSSNTPQPIRAKDL